MILGRQITWTFHMSDESLVNLKMTFGPVRRLGREGINDVSDESDDSSDAVDGASVKMDGVSTDAGNAPGGRDGPAVVSRESGDLPSVLGRPITGMYYECDGFLLSFRVIFGRGVCCEADKDGVCDGLGVAALGVETAWWDGAESGSGFRTLRDDDDNDGMDTGKSVDPCLRKMLGYLLGFLHLSVIMSRFFFGFWMAPLVGVPLAAAGRAVRCSGSTLIFLWTGVGASRSDSCLSGRGLLDVLICSESCEPPLEPERTTFSLALLSRPILLSSTRLSALSMTLRSPSTPLDVTRRRGVEAAVDGGATDGDWLLADDDVSRVYDGAAVDGD
jgi:hypothetical protein